MTSLIERLRNIAMIRSIELKQPIENMVEHEGADALEQARELVEILDSPFYGKNQDEARAWLRLIDGEQEKEQPHD